MLSLDGTKRYWLYSQPVDMRKGLSGLSTIACELMGHQMRKGDVFIFVGTRRNMLKLLHREDGFMVMCSIRMDLGRVTFKHEDLPDPAAEIDYNGLVRLIESATKSGYVRRVKILAKNLRESEK